MTFAMDYIALIIVAPAAVVFYCARQWSQRFAAPYIYFPIVNSLQSNTSRARWSRLPSNLLSAALLLFSCAFIDPHFFVDNHQIRTTEGPESHSPVEGIAIYFILDQSGSMGEEVDTVGGRSTKINLLKKVTREFIAGDPNSGLKGRPNDMIGLVFFARAARVQSPLTLDHAAVLQQLSRFSPVPERDQDGTSIGYAIYKTASMITATRQYAQELVEKGNPSYNIKSSVMILVTDGLQDPNPLDKGKRLRNMDVPEAAAYAKKQGIHLYIVNVEPKLSTEEFAPYRHIMQRAAAVTGGKFYMVDNTGNLSEIYQQIDSLEKSALPEDSRNVMNKDLRPDLFRRISLSFYLIGLGLIALLTALTLEMTILRRVP